MPSGERDGDTPERRIGPYRLLRELGHGGMGTVYLAARADEQFEKRVALKVIRGADSSEVVRHFKRERQILASLDHPNIAKLLDGGTTDDALPYFVMEHIEGEQILRYCDARSLPVSGRLKLFLPVCSAVQYAHRNLVVHRDLKPGNILVTADGAPKLLDFGIAKLLNPELAGEAPTATAMVMTPAYASPEQVRGEPITTASDVYSLGVVLYELLTGRHPYRLARAHPLDVLRAISEQEPEKPSTVVGGGAAGPDTALTLTRGEATWAAAPTRDVAELAAEPVAAPTAEALARTRERTPERLRRRLRGDLDNILMMALSKEPQRRYASAEAFADDLRRCLEGMPVIARKPTLGYRAGKFVSRNLAAVAASAVVLALLVAFAVAMAVQSARVARERDLARTERAAAQRQRETAQRVSAFLVDLFKVSDPSEARGNTITAREVLDKGAEKIARELNDEPEVRATMMNAMGAVYNNIGLLDKATPLLEEALRTRRRLLGNGHAEVADTLYYLGAVRRSRGDYAGAEALHREALGMRRRLFSQDNLDVARSLNALGTALSDRGRMTEAAAALREALEIRRRLLGGEHVDVAWGIHNLAFVLYQQGDYASAEPLFREAIAMQRRLLGDDHPNLAWMLNNLANLRVDKGGYDEAEAIHREVLAIRRKVYGEKHPLVAQSLGNLANALSGKGDNDAAESLYREVVAMLRSSFGNDHPEVSLYATNLAQVLAEKGKRVEAEALFREGLAQRRRLLGNEHPQVLYSLAGLANLLLDAGRPLEAESLSREATDLARRILPEAHPLTADLQGTLGASLAAQRRYSEAEPLLLASLPVLTEKTGERSPETRRDLRRIVLLYEAWGQPEKAAPYRSRLAAKGPDAGR